MAGHLLSPGHLTPSLKEEESKGRITERILHSLIHSPDAHNSRGRLELAARNSVQASPVGARGPSLHLGHHLLPSQVH